MQGWEPTEVHEYVFDDDGKQVGVTVTREVEWDGPERDKMQALAIYEAGVCDCGLHQTVAEKNPFVTIDKSACPVCRDLAEYWRIQAAEDEQALKELGDHPKPSAARPDDGRKVGLRILTAEEAEEMKQKTAAPR